MSYCKANYCRYNNDHNTFYHKCGGCGQHGHGNFECQFDDLKSNLKNNPDYFLELPQNLWCSISECPYPKTHTINSHRGDFIFKTISCPICKTINNILTNNNKVYHSSKGNSLCCVCLENECNTLLPSCRHVCLCQECFNALGI